MNSNDAKSWINQARMADDQRPDLPGEHWAVMGAGLLLVLAA